MRVDFMAVLKSLVSVAWADGDFTDHEREMLDALLEAYEASDEQAAEIREYAKTKRTLDDLPWDELSPDDCRLLLQNAVLLSWVDGHQDDKEKAFIDQLWHKLGLPEDEAKALIAASDERAKSHLDLLKS